MDVQRKIANAASDWPDGPEADASRLRAHLDRLLTVSARYQRDFGEGDSVLRAVLDERNLLQTLIDRVPDVLFIKDTASTFLVANEATAANKKFVASDEPVTAATLIGKNDFDLFPLETAQKYRDIEVQIMRSGVPMLDKQDLYLDGTGRSKWLSMSKVPFRDANNEVIGIIGIGRDVTLRRQAEERVQFLAHHDALTGLPNRALFAERLGQEIRQAKRMQRGVTVIFLDLDKFKVVNDSLGHQAGDTLLKTMADRMVSCLRETDTVARLGGDEFVILLTDPPNGAEGLAPIVEKIRSCIAAPVEISKHQFSATSSIGVASYPEDGQDPEELLAHADAAMYRAKALGRDSFQFYTAAMSESTAERLALAEDLRRALPK